MRETNGVHGFDDQVVVELVARAKRITHTYEVETVCSEIQHSTETV